MDQKTRVEVQKDGAWTEAVIVDAYGRGRGRHYKVRYDRHPDSDAQRLTQEEDVRYTRVRPIPPEAPHNYNYSIRDAVEASDKGCWWPGIITQAMSTNSELFLVYFPHNHIQKMYHYSKLRPAQEWLKGKWYPLPSQQTNKIIYEGKYPMPANSETTSKASSPWDMQANAQSQKKFEGRPKKRNDVEQNQKGNSLSPHSIGVKRLYVYDDRKDGNDRGIKATPGNDVKRFKVTESTESMDQILKYTETPVERCTGSAILGSPRTELDNKAQRNNPLNMVAEERLETHDEELLAYHSVLEAFYAQSQCHLSWERHDFLTRLRIALHITTDEHADKLKRLISQS
eukprot:PITA_18016